MLPRQRLPLVLEQRRVEVLVGSCAVVFGLLMMVLTAPPIIAWLLRSFDPTWAIWTRGLLERLGSSAVVTATVSWLNLLFHWLDHSRRPAIKWALQ